MNQGCLQADLRASFLDLKTWENFCEENVCWWREGPDGHHKHPAGLCTMAVWGPVHSPDLVFGAVPGSTRAGTRFPHSQFIWLTTDHFGWGCCDPLVFRRAVWAPSGELRCGELKQELWLHLGALGIPLWQEGKNLALQTGGCKFLKPKFQMGNWPFVLAAHHVVVQSITQLNFTVVYCVVVNPSYPINLFWC